MSQHIIATSAFGVTTPGATDEYDHAQYRSKSTCMRLISTTYQRDAAYGHFSAPSFSMQIFSGVRTNICSRSPGGERLHLFMSNIVRMRISAENPIIPLPWYISTASCRFAKERTDARPWSSLLDHFLCKIGICASHPRYVNQRRYLQHNKLLSSIVTFFSCEYRNYSLACLWQ